MRANSTVPVTASADIHLITGLGGLVPRSNIFSSYYSFLQFCSDRAICKVEATGASELLNVVAFGLGEGMEAAIWMCVPVHFIGTATRSRLFQVAAVVRCMQLPLVRLFAHLLAFSRSGFGSWVTIVTARQRCCSLHLLMCGS